MESDIEQSSCRIADKQDDERSFEQTPVCPTSESINPTVCRDESKSDHNDITSERNDVKTNLLNLIDNDSDSDTDTENVSVKKNRLAIINSDSEEEIDSESRNDIDSLTTDVTSELDGDVEDFNHAKSLKARLSALCDSESSDEERNNESESENNMRVDVRPGKVYKKKSNKSQEPKPPKPMTGKKAMEQRLEIQSDSQRRVREKRVSLPYHKPKSYTLKEFMERRPRLSSALPANNTNSNVSPAIAMKMSLRQLEIVSKNLEEREKQVEEFYKSESDTDQEENVQEETRAVVAVVNGDDCEKPAEETIQTCDELESKICTISTATHDVVVVDPATETEISAPTANANPEVVGLAVDNAIRAPSENARSPERNDSEAPNESPKNETSNDFETEDTEFEYTFNLDDIEEQADLPCEQSHLDQIIEENVVINPSVETTAKAVEETAAIKKLNPLRALQLNNCTPRLSGGPDQVIDLSDDKESNEITKLMERFIKHSSTKKSFNKKVELQVLSVAGDEVHSEKLLMALHPEDDTTEMVELPPGARLKKLKGQLEQQMAVRRSEVWKQRIQTAHSDSNKDADPYADEKSECGVEDLLNNEDEEETDCSSSSDEDDDLEDDVVVKDKPRVKSAFVEEEAEESDEEEDDEDITNDPDNIVEPIENPDADDDSSSNDSIEMSVAVDKSSMKRIATAFEDDSDDEELNDDPADLMRSSEEFQTPSTPTPRENKDRKSDEIPESTQIVKNVSSQDENDSKTNSSLDITDPWEDDEYITPHQPRADRTPCRSSTQTKSDLGFCTPGLRLTALQGFSVSKESPAPESPFPLPPEPSPLRNTIWPVHLQKKLFSDSENSESQTNMSELADMCSGKFPSSTFENVQSDSDNFGSCTQDLLGICSGKFTGMTQFSSAETDDGEVNKSMPDEDPILSELLKEDELEMFKKRLDDDYESPSLLKSLRNSGIPKPERVQSSSNLNLESSDDDDDEDGEKVVKKKRSGKNLKKLDFSDDENEEAVDSDDAESCDNDEVDGDDVLNVNYDSEENEIEENSEEAIRQANEFFENEAELSESDWGSADEDEKDLDDLEFEKGDEEDFDTKKLKNDLERIHMRRLLDDDQREVKILQEMLLEDGELHGKGRQRQFRWKNIDNIGEDGATSNNENDVDGYMDEEESEEQWRRMRYERETFLKEQKLNTSKMCNNEIDDGNELLDDISVNNKIHIEQTILKNNLGIACKTSSSVTTNVSVESEVDVKMPFALASKRGSFLARKDNVLTRLAEYTKVSTTVANGPKNSRNFVFQSVENKTEALKLLDKKRKAASGTPYVLKKMRLSENLSPANIKKLSKNANNRAKKLFD